MINLVHLYPKEMNIYGDNGNLIVLFSRLKWRNIEYKIINVGVNDRIPTNAHFILGGGGQDAGQSKIVDDLKSKANTLKGMSRNGVPMLMICGMYQMFGHYFKPQTGNELPGIGIFNTYTIAKKTRLIGNITVVTEWGEVVGYENHSGQTYLNEGVQAFGQTSKNCGNNGQDRTEGAIQNNVYGSYLHGPLLARAPIFCDHLISLILEIAGRDNNLSPLNDDLELAAASVAKGRRR